MNYALGVVYDGNNTLESWCHVLWCLASHSFSISHFNIIVLTFSGNLWHIGMGPCGWPVGASLKVSCIMLIAVSLFKLWLSVIECNGFRAVWDEAVASEKCLYFIESKLQCPYAFWGNFVLVVLIFHKFFQASWHFALKMYCNVHVSDVIDAFIIPYCSYTSELRCSMIIIV